MFMGNIIHVQNNKQTESIDSIPHHLPSYYFFTESN